MAISITHNINPNEQKFNGLRRTKEGMLYLTSVNPNETGEIQFSTYCEDGKSDKVPKDGTATGDALASDGDALAYRIVFGG